MGEVGPPSQQYRSTEVSRSVHRVDEVGRPKSPSRSSEIVRSVHRSQQAGPPKSPRKSGAPRWARAVPSIEAPSSMDGLGFVNGLSRVRQWIEQRDSMDGTMRFYGWNKPFQWIDNRPSITDDFASHFSRKVGNLAMAKCGSGIGRARQIPAAEWRNQGGGRGETECPADAARGAAAAGEVAAAAEVVAGEEKWLFVHDCGYSFAA